MVLVIVTKGKNTVIRPAVNYSNWSEIGYIFSLIRDLPEVESLKPSNPAEDVFIKQNVYDNMI